MRALQNLRTDRHFSEPSTIGEAIKWGNITVLSCKYCIRKRGTPGRLTFVDPRRSVPVPNMFRIVFGKKSSDNSLMWPYILLRMCQIYGNYRNHLVHKNWMPYRQNKLKVSQSSKIYHKLLSFWEDKWSKLVQKTPRILFILLRYSFNFNLSAVFGCFTPWCWPCYFFFKNGIV